MFWRFGGYANISAIDNILDKAEFTLEELLDESDLIQELKQHNGKLLDYLRQRQVLEKLLEYVVAPKLEPVAVPDDEEDGDDDKGKGRSLPFGRSRSSSRATDAGNEEEEAEKKRNKYAYVACEVLSSDNWSICEALMESSSRDLLQKFWTFLERPTPLDPLQASYFTKVNESLFDKKTEEMIDFLKTIDGAIPHMLRHVDSPMVMDLLLKIISLERTESGQGVVEWLYTQDLMPSLLAFLDPKYSWATQTSAGDFMKAIITVSANASQNEQTCIGPNELTRQLVSRPCVQQLIDYMLGGGNALTVGVGIVIEVIRKNNSDYDPDVGAEANSAPSSRDPIYLGTLLRMFADNVPNFMGLIMNAPAQKARLESTFGDKIEPLGFDRFKTCELMAELLHCSNMGLLNEVGSEALIAARDAERQRLREEGKLEMPGAGRLDEMPSSSEELTMRISHHSSPADEGRRLEVTNITTVPDDDGFEEVPAPSSHGAPGVEDEDTSHEFVKAEDELPSHTNKPMPPSSFLDKDDEDDFVDEPLSSPRLKVSDDKVSAPTPEEQRQYDDPELVVAPLSPSKRKFEATPAAPASESTAKAADESSKVGETTEKIEELSLEDLKPSPSEVPVDKEKGEKTEAKEGEAGEPSITFAPTVSSIVTAVDAVKKSEDSTLHPQEAPASFEKELSPHPEDLPAPLFSSSPANPAATLAAPAEPTEPVPVPAAEPEKGAAADATDADQGDASIIVGHQPEAPPAPSAPEEHVEPVVGDYLKMQFVQHRVVPTILSFFFKYPWNNFLHNVVYDIVQQVFNGPMDRGYNPSLAVSLFEAADVTSKIIEGQLASEQSQIASKTRMGYMGHLTLIAEEVVKFTERHPPELLSETVLDKVMAQDWINYVEGALAETRERDNAILGGVRPEVAMSNRAAGGGLAGVGLTGLGSALSLGGGGGGSNALAEAGLNGGNLSDMQGGSESSSAGPFSISAGISSSFHSSSDEEEDDDVGDDEDINNEFRSYTNPLSNTDASSSLNPPSIPPPPPPPPPLNIPPSRARLQLAARLAMNKRNAEEAAAAGGSGAGSSSADNDGNGGLQAAAPISEQRLRNPFADHGDDDDDDDLDDDDDVDDDMRDEDGSDDGNELGDRGPGSWRARGSWWRGVVRSRRAAAAAGSSGGGGGGGGGGGASAEDEIRRRERFGDGRDSDESSGDEVGVDEDEEFGDFAMPEVVGSSAGTTGFGGSGGGGGGEVGGHGSGTVLVKPLALHPPSSSAGGGSASGGSKFPSLWPFEGLGFGGSSSKKDDEGEKAAGGGGGGVGAGAGTDTAAGAGEQGSKDVGEKEKKEKKEKKEEEPLEVLSEDGQRVSRAVEAKRRTSIEDPDEDEEQVVV